MTSASLMAFKPFNVINSGSPGPAPTKYTFPYETLPSRLASYENRDHHELWLSHRHELQSPKVFSVKTLFTITQ